MEKEKKKKEEEIRKRLEEERRKEEEERKKRPHIPVPIGLNNMGNTCYFNSVCQSLINLPILKDIILNPNIKYFKNRNEKYNHNGIFFDELKKLFEYRWIEEWKENKSKSPKNLKKIVGKIREDFSDFNQQDANEFLNFVLDELHEELNLKNKRIYIPNPDDQIALNNTKEELSNIYWANSIRRSASFINAIFSFQIENILTCEKCHKSKSTFENCTNLYLPIPLSKLIDVNIVFYRLPFCYKIYYDEINEEFKEFNFKNCDNSKVENLKMFSFNKLSELLVEQEKYEKVLFERIERKKKEKAKEEEEKKQAKLKKKQEETKKKKKEEEKKKKEEEERLKKEEEER